MPEEQQQQPSPPPPQSLRQSQPTEKTEERRLPTSPPPLRIEERRVERLLAPTQTQTQTAVAEPPRTARRTRPPLCPRCGSFGSIITEARERTVSGAELDVYTCFLCGWRDPEPHLQRVRTRYLG